jgi:CHAD domain-containing protein
MSRSQPTPLAEHLAKTIRKARHRYCKRLARCRRKLSQRAVHDLRVETRRILVLLELLCRLGFFKSQNQLSKTVRKRLKAFGDLRDVQVELELLNPFWARFPNAIAFKTLLERREEKLAAKLSAKIGEPKFAAINEDLKRVEKRICKSAAFQTVTLSKARDVLGAVFCEVEALREQVRREDPTSIHQMRVAFKRFRYLNELLQPALRGITDPLLARMKDYQQIAGAVQDFEVLIGRLAREVKHRKLNPAKIRDLRAELLQKRKQAVEKFLQRVDDFKQFPTFRLPEPLKKIRSP